MSPRSNRETSTWSAVNFKKHMASMSCRLEPAIWSRDTGKQTPCFDRCQLIITWMSNVKEVHCKPSLHVPVNLLFGGWPPSCVTPPSSSRAYAPTSNTASHNNHEKINSWVSFSFLYGYEAPLGDPLGRRSSAMTVPNRLYHRPQNCQWRLQ